MGADLIISTLAIAAPADVEDPLTFAKWDAGHARIDAIVKDLSKDQVEALLDELGLYELGDKRSLKAMRVSLAEDLHARLDAIKGSLENPGRDIDWRRCTNFTIFLTGGMSWGESPTEAMEEWTGLDVLGNALDWPLVESIFDAVGFIWNWPDKVALIA